MLDRPHVVEAEPVGQHDLLQRVAQEVRFAALSPRPGELVLVEDPEPHARRSYGLRRVGSSSRATGNRWLWAQARGIIVLATKSRKREVGP